MNKHIHAASCYLALAKYDKPVKFLLITRPVGLDKSIDWLATEDKRCNLALAREHIDKAMSKV